MINKINRVLIIGALIAIGLMAYSTFNRDINPIGSVARGGEMQATTTNNFSDGFNTIVSNRSATLGTIVVSSSSPSSAANIITIWNATSTVDVASTSIKIRAGLTEGTYTFDAIRARGLIIDKPAGFNGFYTITWR